MILLYYPLLLLYTPIVSYMGQLNVSWMGHLPDRSRSRLEGVAREIIPLFLMPLYGAARGLYDDVAILDI
jgi:hypothetical protein